MTNLEYIVLFPVRVIGVCFLSTLLIAGAIDDYFKKDDVISCKFCKLGACNCKNQKPLPRERRGFF